MTIGNRDRPLTAMRRTMEVAGLTIDAVNNAPIVILREREGERILPIWIGVVEASAIAFELEAVKLTRPMTHDLLRATIEALGGAVAGVAITGLRENTYFATITITHRNERVELDARPSDAIALALRTKTPIDCEEEVLAAAHERQQQADRTAPAGPSGEGGEGGEVDRGEGGPRPIVEPQGGSLAELLESLPPEDFGKYKM